MKKIYLSLALVVAALSNSIAQGPPIVLVWDLANGDYGFTSWAPASPAETYPQAMMFKQYNLASTDPAMADEPNEDWRCLYNLTARSRIVGRADSGVVFLNTQGNQDSTECDLIDGNSIAGGKVGAAVLTLSSLNREAVTVSFTSGITQQSSGTPNPRIYNLQLQARTDSASASAWTDVSGGMYSSAGDAANSIENFSNLVLPAAFNNQSIIQLRWKVYQDATAGVGSRPGVVLDNITVSSSIFTGIGSVDNASVKLQVYPNPVEGNILSFNKEITAQLFDISGRELASVTKASTLELAGISTGVYTLRTSNGEVVKVSVK